MPSDCGTCWRSQGVRPSEPSGCLCLMAFIPTGRPDLAAGFIRAGRHRYPPTAHHRFLIWGLIRARCIRCGHRCEPASATRRFLKARPKTWFWLCTNWQRTPSAMAAERDGCGYGTWPVPCIARLTTVIRRCPPGREVTTMASRSPSRAAPRTGPRSIHCPASTATVCGLYSKWPIRCNRCPAREEPASWSGLIVVPCDISPS
jgi:hypothetical protein